ncbi:MAG TPA: glycosyltransferase WbuB [Anaerolineaceae bacterium]|nr:glycosyltransferase WbuB [Anaerolineaceae bacterium]
MHVLLIHQAFAGLNEAGGTRHYEMAQYLARHGHQVTIIASPVSYLTGKSAVDRIHWVNREEPEPGITILRTYTYSALHRSFVHRVFSFFSFMFSSFWVGCSIKNVSVVWGTTPPIFQGFTAWMLARLKRVRLLFEVRDLWPEFAIAVGVLKNPVLIRLSLWLESFLYRHSDLLVVNSPGFIDPVHSRGARSVVLIPNGVNPDMFDPHSHGVSYRKQWEVENAFVVLYAGAFGLSNDLIVVLDTAVILRENQNVKFVLIGDGKEREHLQKYAADKHLSNVYFSPPVAKNEMSEVLAASDACIAILKPLEMYKTTYPNKIFDYMAAGRPTLCCIDGVIRKVIEESDSGVFVPPGNPAALSEAILKLSQSPELCRKMGVNARLHVEKYFNREQFSAIMEEKLMNLGRNQ